MSITFPSCRSCGKPQPEAGVGWIVVMCTECMEAWTGVSYKDYGTVGVGGFWPPDSKDQA